MSCGCFVWVESAKAFPDLVLHLHFVPHCLIDNCSPLTNYNHTDSHRWSSLSTGKETCLQSVACGILITLYWNVSLFHQFVLYVDPCNTCIIQTQDKVLNPTPGHIPDVTLMCHLNCSSNLASFSHALSWPTMNSSLPHTLPERCTHS